MVEHVAEHVLPSSAETKNECYTLHIPLWLTKYVKYRSFQKYFKCNPVKL